jgi:hypothetical protein
LAKYGKGVYHMVVRIYNGLSNKLKIISNNSNKFKEKVKGIFAFKFILYIG